MDELGEISPTSSKLCHFNRLPSILCQIYRSETPEMYHPHASSKVRTHVSSPNNRYFYFESDRVCAAFGILLLEQCINRSAVPVRAHAKQNVEVED